ncbi:MAG: helix-turn-helix domain-containing protein [Methanolinea sp.]|nr:helix-turn-helix domain-containing protein [Methanolinea sp.]
MENSSEDRGPGQPDPQAPEGEVIILVPGDERSQKIAKAISSQAAGDVLHALERGPQTAGALASALAMPMGTVKYHIENLLEAGLIEVRDTKYSVKGRQVKVYGLRNQLLIMAPKVQNIRSILLKYAALFGVVVLSSLAAYAFLAASRLTTTGYGGGDRAAFQAEKTVNILAAPTPAPSPFPQTLPADIALAFFFGGVLVLIILLLYEVSVWRRMK